ncbi:SatD family protein [Algoriphagus halophytocola]|uniref:SatD family protein n=1 Tax=Algoriphagus halophytocola TaxID=2991499 RepID=A0ABY6MIG4_9BACT|nr:MULTISPECIES: SatD family protein [unclassified Algoriphagus]UZD23418.1 SatD family protein [Algoriphagus sp. TR-M5]WBL44713.1 SatD family protein [Algoriphagus sp. TR-M9]
MIAILTADIINSRDLENQNLWISPLKNLLRTWGNTPKQWEIFRGDSFQLEITDPMESLLAALQIKALVKSLPLSTGSKRISPIDVRMAIGIGEKNHDADRISESNGEAFIRSGEKFEQLKSEMTNLAINSPWKEWNTEINLYLKLAGIQMDSWSISSGEVMSEILHNPDRTQAQIGKTLNINQNSVSKRYKAAHGQNILELEKLFRKKLSQHL